MRRPAPPCPAALSSRRCRAKLARITMRFSPQFLDELRARLPVSEVVGRRVKLRKAGREWKGLSPFNKEKTPSFFVNDQKAMWFDFSSGKNGNIFDFVMLTEGVTFPEAVERLAGEAGVPLPVLTREAQAQRRAPQDPARRRRACGEILRGDARVARRRARPRLSRRPRHRSGDAAQVPARLCAGGAIRAQGASRRRKDFGRGHGRGGASGRRRRHRGALRPLPRPRDVPDRRLARPRHRLRRPRARQGRRRPNTSTRRRRRSSTRARRSTISPPPASRQSGRNNAGEVGAAGIRNFSRA